MWTSLKDYKEVFIGLCLGGTVVSGYFVKENLTSDFNDEAKMAVTLARTHVAEPPNLTHAPAEMKAYYKGVRDGADFAARNDAAGSHDKQAAGWIAIGTAALVVAGMGFKKIPNN